MQRQTLNVMWIGAAFVALGSVVVSSQSPAGAAQSPVKVKPPSSTAAKAAAPAASTTTQKKTSIGGAQAKLDTSDHAQDSDSFWLEEIDIDGDGNLESADLVWDDEDKVLFLHDEGAFTCQNGGQGNGEMLMAIFADGNARKAPAGSGWYVVGLDAGECGAKTAGLFGCRFDASGQPTSCGVAIIDDATDDAVIKPTSAKS